MRFHKVKHPVGGAKRGPKDANIQYFNGDYEEKIDILVRETIQNPLDHPLNVDEPIKIVFKQRYIATDEIPNKSELLETLKALLSQIKLHKQSDTGIAAEFEKFYQEAVKKLSLDKICILQISDYHTTGLTGSRSDMKSDIGRFLGGVGWWDDSSSGGGSGGLGKFAPFRFSGVNFCLYSSFNTNNEYIYYGWGTNFYHQIGREHYTGESIMGNEVGGDFDVVKLKKPLTSGFLCERRELGSDVFALDFIKDKQGTIEWRNEMAKATIRNFFGAIIEKKLIVEVEEYGKEKIVVDYSTIEEHLTLFNPLEFSNSKDYLADGFTVEAVNCYMNGEKYDSEKGETPILGECFIRIVQDDELSRYFTFMRGPRMLIKVEKIRSGDLAFAGVFVCCSKKGNEVLRRLEDSHHKDWKYESTADKKVRKEITEFIKRVVEKVAKFDNPDEFTISGSKLLSLGGNTSQSESGDNGEGEQIEEAAVVIPKNTITTKVKSSDFGGEFKIKEGGKKKKTKPKKQRYKKPNEGGTQPPGPPKKKREYRVDDFNAIIFKNDAAEKEYHLFIDSPEVSDIRTISFEILGGDSSMKDISFIEGIFDKHGDSLSRDTRPGYSINSFENFSLLPGKNKFIVKMKFDKKIQLLIN